MSFHLVGIDEAGYGPQLGPLVVSAAVLELPDNLLARPHPIPKITCLWKTLSTVVANNRSSGKVAVCDSKALYNPSRGLRELEKTALVFRRLIEPDYRSHSELPLPLSADNNEINKFSRLLQAELNRNSIRFCEARVSIVEPADFNHGIRRLGNKADFLWEVSGNLIRHCVDKYNHNNRVVIRAGKQGGRNYYLPHLRRLFPDRTVRPVEQGFNRSSYIIEDRALPDAARPFGRGSPKATISFIKDGDASEFVIALASIFSKYYRELSMFKLNRFFRSHIPSLEPTSGYPTDSKRFIRKISPIFGKLNLDRNNFVRIK